MCEQIACKCMQQASTSVKFMKYFFILEKNEKILLWQIPTTHASKLKFFEIIDTEMHIVQVKYVELEQWKIFRTLLWWWCNNKKIVGLLGCQIKPKIWQKNWSLTVTASVTNELFRHFCYKHSFQDFCCPKTLLSLHSK